VSRKRDGATHPPVFERAYITVMKPNLDRRLFLTGCAAAALSSCSAGAADAKEQPRFAASPFRKLSDAEWKQRLPPASYSVLRRDDTERPGSSPLDRERRRGTFVCRGCDLPLFKSEWKFDSGTGWPSFYTAIKENIGTKSDRILLLPRTEYHCGRCLGHQGHIFEDGPKPTGLRYCNNGVALKFVPA